MGHQLREKIKVSELCDALGLDFVGHDLEILSVEPLGEACEGSLTFSKRDYDGFDRTNVALIVPSDFKVGHQNCALILTDNPRLCFVKCLQYLNKKNLFAEPACEPSIGEGVIISPSATIGNNVQIGDGTFIGHNVVIGDNVTIGKNCYIKSNTVIGEPGFGFERDENELPLRFIHIGKVVIGDYVEIGALTTVVQATLGKTIIEDHAKIDDHVHIAHNCHIKKGALITACAELSGGVVIGEFAWVGPNSSFKQNLTIGSRALVGIGTNVLKNVNEEATVFGNPAKPLRKFSSSR